MNFQQGISNPPLKFMLKAENQQLTEYLSQFLTEIRKQKIEEVLQQRTRYITAVIEDISQSYNASATLRNCDAFGIQDLHIIENRNKFTLHRDVSLGSEQWLTLYRYNEQGSNNTQQCINYLKAQGYTIVATTPYDQEFTLEQLPLDHKLAFLFGSEVKGLSEYAMNQADILVKIPMVGFSASLNISVTVALCLYEIINRLKQQRSNWGLTNAEKQEIRLKWIRQSIRACELLEQKFEESKNSATH